MSTHFRTAAAGIVTSCIALTMAACSTNSGGAGGGTGSASSASGGGTSTLAAAARAASVVITAAGGCVSDHTTLRAGGIDFTVSNKDATAVSEVELLSGERIVGEKENLPAGFTGKFSVDVDAGSYTLYCPGAAKERSTITVTGKSAATKNASVAALLAPASKGYATYVSNQVAEMVSAAEKLDVTLHGTSLSAAQQQYMKSRSYYEKIEPVAESFVIGKDSIDADIDARANDVPASQWRGFHRIEKALFADKTLRGTAVYGDRLVVDIKRLQKLTTGLTYKPTELANGAQSLMDEVSSSKITGEEERYSHIDLLDFANNDEGAEQAFAQLQPALAKIDPALTSLVEQRFIALDKLVDSYRTGTNASGFKLYTQLTAADKRTLAAAVKAVSEPLSTVGSKVAAA